MQRKSRKEKRHACSRKGQVQHELVSRDFRQTFRTTSSLFQMHGALSLSSLETDPSHVIIFHKKKFLSLYSTVIFDGDQNEMTLDLHIRLKTIFS